MPVNKENDGLAASLVGGVGSSVSMQSNYLIYWE